MFHKNDSTRRLQPRQFDTYDEFNERVRRAQRRKVTDPPQRPVTHGFRRTESDVRFERPTELSYTVWAISIQAFLDGKPEHAASYTTAPSERAAGHAAYDTALRVFPKRDGYERHNAVIVRIDPMYFEL